MEAAVLLQELCSIKEERADLKWDYNVITSKRGPT
jgi:hypothetical protein